MRQPAWLGQAVAFIAIGGLAFVLDAGVLLALHDLGMPPLIARAISLSLSIVFTWRLNRRFTFRRTDRPTLREFLNYSAISVASIAINYAVFSGLVLLKTHLLLATAAGTAIAAVFNFVRYRVLLSKTSAADPTP